MPLDNPSSGSGAAPLVGRRAAIIGDSREAAFNVVEGNGETRTQARAHLQWASFFLQGRLTYNQALCWGYTGQTAQYELSQYPTTVAANYANFDVLFIEGPTNNLDFTSNLFAAGGAIPAVLSMVTQALAAGKYVALLPISPRSSWPSLTDPQIVACKKQMAQYNRWAAALANSTQGVIFINCFNDLAASTGDPIANATVDGLHYSNFGAMIVGQRIAATFLPFLAATVPIPAISTELYDATLAPRGNILTNVGMTGTGGTKGVNGGGSSTLVSGNVPTGWDVSRGEGTAAGLTTSQAAQTTGFGGKSSSFSITIAFGSSASTLESFLFTQTFAQAMTAGKSTQASISLDVSNVANLIELEIVHELSGGPYQQWATFEDGSGIVQNIPNGSYVLQSPPSIVPAGTTGGSIKIYARFNPSLGACSATFTFYDPSIVYLN